MEKLDTLQFCIVGCGGTGANFAEMLVRTGARRLILIDGGNVKRSGLNRVFGFTDQDIGNPKVLVLEQRLKSIGRANMDIYTLFDSFRQPDQIMDDNVEGQKIRDAVHDADVVFIASDTNSSRLGIERLCRDKDGGIFLSCGVRVDRGTGIYEFECAVSPKTPEDMSELEGYGPENASFASIVMEATSVAFSMLLGHLRDHNCQFRNYRRKYDMSFTPIETRYS